METQAAETKEGGGGGGGGQGKGSSTHTRPPSKASCFTPNQHTVREDKAAGQSRLLSVQRGCQVSTLAKPALGAACSCQRPLLALCGAE